jgi:hypothetical protein
VSCAAPPPLPLQAQDAAAALNSSAGPDAAAKARTNRCYDLNVRVPACLVAMAAMVGALVPGRTRVVHVSSPALHLADASEAAALTPLMGPAGSLGGPGAAESGLLLISAVALQAACTALADQLAVHGVCFNTVAPVASAAAVMAALSDAAPAAASARGGWGSAAGPSYPAKAQPLCRPLAIAAAVMSLCHGVAPAGPAAHGLGAVPAAVSGDMFLLREPSAFALASGGAAGMGDSPAAGGVTARSRVTSSASGGSGAPTPTAAFVSSMGVPALHLAARGPEGVGDSDVAMASADLYTPPPPPAAPAPALVITTAVATATGPASVHDSLASPSAGTAATPSVAGMLLRMSAAGEPTGAGLRAKQLAARDAYADDDAHMGSPELRPPHAYLHAQ